MLCASEPLLLVKRLVRVIVIISGDVSSRIKYESTFLATDSHLIFIRRRDDDEEKEENEADLLD